LIIVLQTMLYQTHWPCLKFIFPCIFLIFISFKNINFKTFLILILILYITSTFFYYFLNKKLTTIQFFFFSLLFHINYFNFISYQFYFSIIQKKILKIRAGAKNFQTGHYIKISQSIDFYTILTSTWLRCQNNKRCNEEETKHFRR
jgi:Zn-dependent protease with chaperone function